MLKFNEIIKGSYSILEVIGAIKAGLEFDFADRIELLIKNENSKLIINLSGVPFMNAAALGILLHSYKKIKDKGRLIICGLSDDCKNLFEITKLGLILECCETLEEAENRIK